MLAEYLKSSVKSIDSIPLDNCNKTDPEELANILREEADRQDLGFSWGQHN